MDPREINRRSAVTESVIRDLEGAGLLSHPNVNRQAIIDGLLRGDGGSNDVKQYQLLQHYTNPDTELKGHEDAIYGIPPEELRKFAHRDFQGRGWSTDEMAGLNRGVQNRELSPGSRQAQEWERRRTLTDSLLDEGKPKSIAGKLASLPLPGVAALKSTFTETPEGAFERTRGQKFGESGYFGALENPEYLAGDLFTRYGDPMAAYLQYQLHEGTDGSEADEMAQMRTKAAKMSNTQATKIPSHMDTSTPEAKEKSYKAVKGIYKGLSPKTLDDSTRERTGQYPSYAYSTGASFLENLADPTTLVTAGAGAVGAMRGVLGAFGKASIKEALLEEIPTALGIGGLAGAYQAIPSKPFTPGNEARTDLYNPATGKPETDSEFREKMQGWRSDRSQAKKDFKTYEDYGHPLMTR
jgi:hypothetical protein